MKALLTGELAVVMLAGLPLALFASASMIASSARDRVCAACSDSLFSFPTTWLTPESRIAGFLLPLQRRRRLRRDDCFGFFRYSHLCFSSPRATFSVPSFLSLSTPPRIPSSYRYIATQYSLS